MTHGPNHDFTGPNTLALHHHPLQHPDADVGCRWLCETAGRRCIRKLTGHLPGPGPLRETWLRAMLDEV